MDDAVKSKDSFGAALIVREDGGDALKASGRFLLECVDADGKVLWTDEIENLVTTVGKNFLFASTLQGSGYTVTGPFMGLISSVSFSAVAAADTMVSHAGWTEAATGGNAPAYGATRPTLSFSAPSGGIISTSAAASYVFTNSGTVQGAFINSGAGGSATVLDTGGTLYSAGTLSAAQPVIAGNTLNVSYSGTLT